jgi:hypothetical protein
MVHPRQDLHGNFHVVEKHGKNSSAQNWLYPPSFDSSGLPKVPPIKNKKSHKIKSAGNQFSAFRF